MADTIEKLKSVFRHNLKDQRDLVTPEVARRASESLWTQLKEESFFQKAKHIAAFTSTGSEINTLPLLGHILSSNKKLYLPKTEKTHTLMHFHAVTDLRDLILGSYNILEPPPGIAIPPEQIDLMLVPGLAFDNHGYRLGYGQGYYDRYLKFIRTGCFTLGVAYSFQIIDKIPNADHDIPVNAVLTEKYILLC